MYAFLVRWNVINCSKNYLCIYHIFISGTFVYSYLPAKSVRWGTTPCRLFAGASFSNIYIYIYSHPNRILVTNTQIVNS
jgi:hypothetical protein